MKQTVEVPDGYVLALTPINYEGPSGEFPLTGDFPRFGVPNEHPAPPAFNKPKPPLALV